MAMPEFHYIARDKTGAKIIGQRDASSAEFLADQLQSERLIPLEIHLVFPVQKTKQVPSPFSAFFEKKVPHKELQMFCRQMYTLLKAGIPLITTITRLSETTRNKQLVAALNEVLMTLNQGRTLSIGMSKCPKIFSDFFVNLVKVGETSGQLDRVFLYLAEYVELEIDTKRSEEHT